MLETTLYALNVTQLETTVIIGNKPGQFNIVTDTLFGPEVLAAA